MILEYVVDLWRRFRGRIDEHVSCQIVVRKFPIHALKCRYDGSAIVKKSIALKEPVIVVSMNYR